MPRKFQTGKGSSVNLGAQTISVHPGVGGSPVSPTLVGVVSINPSDQVQMKMGQECRPVFFDTLFDDFDLTVVPHYNFYVVDEENDESEKQYQSLQDLPRYVTVAWRRTPEAQPERPEVTFRKRGTSYSEPVPATRGLKFNRPRVLDFSTVRTMTVNPYISIGIVDVTAVIPSPPSIESGVDEELYLISGGAIPLNHIASNDIPSKKSVVFDGIGTTANVIGRDSSNQSLKVSRASIATRSTMRLTAEAVLGALGESSVSSTSGRLHLENILKLASFSTELGLASSVIDIIDERRSDEPSLPAPAGIPQREYIGYVVEKQKLGSDGVFQTVREFEIDDPFRSYLVDTEVAYGGVYRYRIKCLLRWTHSSHTSLVGDQDTGSLLNSLTPNTAHFVESSWSEFVHVAVLDLVPPNPPDDIRVRTNSRERTIEVSWRYPDDPQRNISSFDLHRRTMRNGLFTSHWVTVASGLKAANGRFVDRDVQVFDDHTERYVYAMTSRSVHGEISDLSAQISCRLNPFSAFEGEAELHQESQPGVPLSAHGALSVLPPMTSTPNVVAKKRLTVVPRTGMSKFVNQDIDVVLRLESLDTGETRDILIDLNNIQTETTDLPPPPIGRVPVDGVFPDEDPRTTPPDGSGPVRPIPIRLSTVV